MNGIIYIAKNSKTGKVYIGQTIVSLNERIGDHLRKATRRESKSHFHNSIRKHGIEIFSWEIIDNAETRDELNIKEKYWISFYNSSNPAIGYNMTFGGDAFEFTEEAKKKIGEAGKGRKLSKEHIEKMRQRMIGQNNPFYGKTHDDKTRVKCGIKNVGRKLTKEHIAKCIHLGETNCNAKINADIVIEIRKAIANGERNCEIQRRLGISKNIFQSVKRGDTWGHVK